MMTAEYEFSYAHYKQAQRLFVKHRPSSFFWYVTFVWALPAAGLCFAGYWLFLWFEGQRRMAHALSGSLYLAAYLGLASPLVRWWKLRRAYDQLFPKGCPHVATIGFDDEFISSVVPGRSEGRFFWPAIVDFAEDEHVALVFIRKKHFLVVPHSAFTDEQWTELRTLIHQKLAENAAARPS